MSEEKINVRQKFYYFALQRLYDNEQVSPDNLEAEGAGSMSCWDRLDLP